jgi:hypothetical protein
MISDVLHFYAPSFRLAQTQQYPGVQYFVFFRHRQEIESMVAAKDRLWLIKIYSSNVGLEPTEHLAKSRI